LLLNLANLSENLTVALGIDADLVQAEVVSLGLRQAGIVEQLLLLLLSLVDRLTLGDALLVKAGHQLAEIVQDDLATTAVLLAEIGQAAAASKSLAAFHNFIIIIIVIIIVVVVVIVVLLLLQTVPLEHLKDLFVGHLSQAVVAADELQDVLVLDETITHDTATLANGANSAGGNPLLLLLLLLLDVLVEATPVDVHQAVIIALHALQLIGIALTLLLDAQATTLFLGLDLVLVLVLILVTT